MVCVNRILKINGLCWLDLLCNMIHGIVYLWLALHRYIIHGIVYLTVHVDITKKLRLSKLSFSLPTAIPILNNIIIISYVVNGESKSYHYAAIGSILLG